MVRVLADSLTVKGDSEGLSREVLLGIDATC